MEPSVEQRRLAGGQSARYLATPGVPEGLCGPWPYGRRRVVPLCNTRIGAGSSVRLRGDWSLVVTATPVHTGRWTGWDVEGCHSWGWNRRPAHTHTYTIKTLSHKLCVCLYLCDSTLTHLAIHLCNSFSFGLCICMWASAYFDYSDYSVVVTITIAITN